MTPFFRYDERLGISVPWLRKDWELYSSGEQFEIFGQWEEIRGRIPERIKAFEQVIIVKQERLGREESFETSCRLNDEISELASRINDLNIWFRAG